jgi:hypothetical protein
MTATMRLYRLTALTPAAPRRRNTKAPIIEPKMPELDIKEDSLTFADSRSYWR